MSPEEILKHRDRIKILRKPMAVTYDAVRAMDLEGTLDEMHTDVAKKWSKALDALEDRGKDVLAWMKVVKDKNSIIDTLNKEYGEFRKSTLGQIKEPERLRELRELLKERSVQYRSCGLDKHEVVNALGDLREELKQIKYLLGKSR